MEISSEFCMGLLDQLTDEKIEVKEVWHTYGPYGKFGLRKNFNIGQQ